MGWKTRIKYCCVNNSTTNLAVWSDTGAVDQESRRSLAGSSTRCNEGTGQVCVLTEPPLRIYLQAPEVVGRIQFLSVCCMVVSWKLPSVPRSLPQSLQGESLLPGWVIILYNVIREVTSHNLSCFLLVKNMSWSHPLKGRG